MTKGKPVRGGAREGAGRKPLDDGQSFAVSVRLTAKQKATFDMLGGREWLRAQLDKVGGS